MRIIELKSAKQPRELAKQQFDRNSVKLSDPLIKQFNRYGINTRFIKAYLQKLSELGFVYTELGSGVKGVVLERPNDPYVIKIFYNDINYLKYIDIIAENQSNPFVPNMRGKVVKIAQGNPGVFVVRLEKLKPLTGKHPLQEKLLDIIDSTSETTADGDFVAAKIGSFIKGAESLKKEQPQLYDLFVKISEKMGPQTELDLHKANMMLRGKQLVITDPVR